MCQSPGRSRTGQSGIAIAAASVLWLTAATAQAAGGGGGGCPWAQDSSVTVAGREIVVPQAVFDPKTPQMSLEGYELVPSLHQLKLSFIGAYGDVWESALTNINGGKRCQAFLVGPPIQVSEALPYNQRKSANAKR